LTFRLRVELPAALAASTGFRSRRRV